MIDNLIGSIIFLFALAASVLFQLIYAIFVLFIIGAILALCVFAIPFILIGFIFWWIWEYLSYRK